MFLLYSYGDAVRELDYGVGRILTTVEKLGLSNNTLAVFSSDNGAATYSKVTGIYWNSFSYGSLQYHKNLFTQLYTLLSYWMTFYLVTTVL